MGRKRGFLALHVGICVGAEVILIPEKPLDTCEVIRIMEKNAAKGKRAGIIVAAEGFGDSNRLTAEMQKQTESEVRLSIIGYAQRGGTPTARSRLLASLFAEKAVDVICKDEGNRAVVVESCAIKSIELEESAHGKKEVDLRLLQVANMLSI
jgi:6-phosphofructokinase 1